MISTHTHTHEHVSRLVNEPKISVKIACEKVKV